MSSQTVVVPHVKHNKRPTGPAAYAKAVRKYNINSPVLIGHNGVVYKRRTALANAHERAHVGHHHHQGHGSSGHPEGDVSEVPAEDVQNDLEYIVPVTIGTPGVTLNLDFDTGSSDLWVWSSELRVDTEGHNIYKPSESSTAKQVSGATWNIHYGDGSGAGGNVFTDVVKIGTLTIPNQAVELAEKLSTQFQQSGSDGLLGLAWPSINTVKPKSVATPVENVIDQKLAIGLFSVALDQGDNNGFYTFGGLDVARAGVNEKDISYTDVDNSQGFWMFPSEITIINGKRIHQSGNKAILDTGTTLCLLSNEITHALYKGIPGAKFDSEQGGWTYPSDSQIPTISLAIGSRLYELNPADVGFGDAGNGRVFGGIQARGNNPFDIMGDVFLKSLYAVFDQENARIGVAHRKGNVQEV